MPAPPAPPWRAACQQHAQSRRLHRIVDAPARSAADCTCVASAAFERQRAGSAEQHARATSHRNGKRGLLPSLLQGKLLGLLAHREPPSASNAGAASAARRNVSHAARGHARAERERCGVQVRRCSRSHPPWLRASPPAPPIPAPPPPPSTFCCCALRDHGARRERDACTTAGLGRRRGTHARILSCALLSASPAGALSSSTKHASAMDMMRVIAGGGCGSRMAAVQCRACWPWDDSRLRMCWPRPRPRHAATRPAVQTGIARGSCRCKQTKNGRWLLSTQVVSVNDEVVRSVSRSAR